MADPPKNVKEKDPLQDLEIGNDFFSWKSISMADGDGLDFDLTPVSKGNKKTFNFDKADMDFNLDSDFGKMSSAFNLDMSDLDMSPPLKKGAKSKENSKEPSSGKDKGKNNRFAFGFDFDDLENFSFDSSTKEGTKGQRDKKNKQNSQNGKEDFVLMDETGRKSMLKESPHKPSLTESQVTFDMDCLVRVADLESTREVFPSNLAMDDSVTPEHSAATDVGVSDRAKGSPKKTISREIPNISPSKRLHSPGQVDLDACTKNDGMPDLSFDCFSNDVPSGGDSSAAEKKVDSMDKNASGSNEEQDAHMTSVASSTSNYRHTLSQNSQHLQAVVVSGNIDEPSGDNSSVVENKVSFMDANGSGSNGEQDANMILVATTTCDYEHTSKSSQHPQTVVISENFSSGRTQDGTENQVEEDKGRTELGQTNSDVENSCIMGAVSGVLCDTQSSSKDQEPALEILKSPLVRQPSDLLEKQTENIKEPHINCSRPFIQSEKPECPVLKASTQTTFNSLSSKGTGFSQPSLVEGRDRDATRSDRKLVSLSLQCSKTLLRGKIPHIQIQKSCNDLKVYGEASIPDGLQNMNRLKDSSTAQVNEKVEIKSAPRKKEMCTKGLDNISMERNRKAAQNSENSKKLASIPSNKNTPAQEHKACSIEGVRKPPDQPGLKISRLSIDSTKSPIWRERKPIGTSSPLLRKSPCGITHISDKWKQTTFTLSMKRTLEEDAANTIALYPSKRRNFVETSEKVLGKKALSNNHMEDDRIKSTTGICQVAPFHISHEGKAKEVDILSLTENVSNIKLADACNKELDDLCDILMKKHNEAKELLVQVAVNSNKLLMLNINPQFDEKISFQLCTFIAFSGFDFHNLRASTLF